MLERLLQVWVLKKLCEALGAPPREPLAAPLR